VLNLALNLALIWPLGVTGLAAATALSALVQVVVLYVLLRRRAALQGPGQVAGAAARAVAATAAMGLVVVALAALPAGVANELLRETLCVVVPVVGGALTYAAVSAALGSREMKSVATALGRRLKRR
jgi:putative peptidoglycan lipid II flippase